MRERAPNTNEAIASAFFPNYSSRAKLQKKMLPCVLTNLHHLLPLVLPVLVQILASPSSAATEGRVTQLLLTKDSLDRDLRRDEFGQMEVAGGI